MIDLSSIVARAKMLAGRVLGTMPEAALGRVLPGEFGFRREAVKRPPSLEGGTRLVIAPLNYAGQAYEWCRAVERSSESIAAQNLMVGRSKDFRHAADYVVPLGAYVASGAWHRTWSTHVLEQATHVIVEGQRQPLGAILTESTEHQVRRLQSAGITVAMVCHGSDIRLPSRHRAREADSPFDDPNHAATRRLETVTKTNAALLRKLALPVFVSTPDLLLDVPEARWLPVVVDPERWSIRDRPLERDIPIVVHTPSSGWIKGSALIEEAMQRLHRESLIEYRRLEGLPHSAMVEAYRSADIVLDQFRIGSYGVAACEAMAAGRVVVGHVSDQVRGRVKRITGAELPVVQSRFADLEDVIRRIVAVREPSRRLAAQGPLFVAEVHDGRRSTAVLAEFLRPRTEQ